MDYSRSIRIGLKSLDGFPHFGERWWDWWAAGPGGAGPFRSGVTKGVGEQNCGRSADTAERAFEARGLSFRTLEYIWCFVDSI